MSRKRKAEARARRECEAHGMLAPWDCYCTFGCDCCRFTHQCSTCGNKHEVHP